MDFRNIRWPVYAIAQREAVAFEGDTPVVLDYNFLMTGQAFLPDGTPTADSGLLLFSSVENAERWLAKTKAPAALVARFRDKKHLLDCVQYFKDLKCLVVLFDRYSDGDMLEIELFRSLVEGQL